MFKSCCYKLITLCAFIELAAGCAAFVTPHVRLDPGAGCVVVTRDKAPHCCVYVGKVIVADVNGESMPYGSNKEIDCDQINALKNKAFKLHANYVVVGEHEHDREVAPGILIVDEQTMGGLAYRCPISVLARATPYTGQKSSAE